MGVSLEAPMVTIRAKRPTTVERRTAMLRAAADVFFEQGYAATNIDAIIERLGGSKRSIYNEFGSKEGLFTALVSELADDALASLAEDQIQGRDLRETLLKFGCRMMALYMEPPLLGVYRCIVSEARRFPELARTVYERGPGRAALRLTEVLEAATRSGQAHIDDCAAAANHFAGMLRGNLHLRVVMRLRPAPGAAEIETFVVSAVDVFLNGISGCPSQGSKGAAVKPAGAKAHE
jgi:AcrR family transcriptional regulator